MLTTLLTDLDIELLVATYVRLVPVQRVDIVVFEFVILAASLSTSILISSVSESKKESDGGGRSHRVQFQRLTYNFNFAASHL